MLGRPAGDSRSAPTVGYLPELFRYQAWLSGREVLAAHCRLAGLPRSTGRRRSTPRCIAAGISERGGDRVGGYSKGMQQRLGLAVALLGDPAVVFLDEPTSALDPVGRLEMRGIVHDLRERGTTIFLNSHLLTEVERVCDRVVILDHGRVVAAGPLADLLSEHHLRVRVTGLDRPAAELLAAFGPLTEVDGYLEIVRPRSGAGAGSGGDPCRGRRPRVRRRASPGDARRALRRGGRGAAAGTAAARVGRQRRFGQANGRLMPLLDLAWLTVREVARRRLFVILVLITVASVALSAWGFSQVKEALSSQDVGNGLEAGGLTGELALQFIYAQLLILVTFMFSFILALSAVFIAAPVIAGELESGIALTILARPVGRSAYLLGKWLGVAAIICVYAVASGLVELVVVDLITGYLPPDPLLGVAYLSAQALVLLSLTILLSTRLSAITAGVACVAIYGLAWIGGIIGGIGVAMGEASIGRIGDLSRLLLPTDGLWRGVVYHLEPRELLLLVDQAGPLTAAFPFLVETPPTPGFLAWCVLWFTVVLGLAVLSFRRREI